MMMVDGGWWWSWVFFFVVVVVVLVVAVGGVGDLFGVTRDVFYARCPFLISLLLIFFLPYY